MYDDPPRLAKIIIKEEGKWTPEELSELLPRTLTKDLDRPPLTFIRGTTPDMKEWKWANGELCEVE